MRGVNKVILLGNLGRDPEIRYSATGSAIANVTVATSEQWKDKTSGERREATEWHRIVFFGRLAEVVGEYLRKGSPIYVEGKLQTRKWQDRDGNERYTTEIVAHEMQMLGGGENSSGDRRGKTPGTTRGPARGDENSPDDFDDDIPF